MRKLLAALSAFVMTVAATSPALARQCADVRMPDSVDVEGTHLVLNGMGIREATVLQVNVYVAGLYVVERSRVAADILGSDTTKRISLHFVHDVERAEIVSAFREGFQRNAPGTPAAKINQLLGWAADMRDGGSMSFTYVPGTGTTFVVNGVTKGTVEGADFGRSVFSLFIGPRPPNAGLRTGLLGGRCG